MFGFSLTKVLVTILVVVAVWRAFTLVERLRQPARGAPPPGGGRRAIDFRPCPRCGDYVAADAECPKCKGSA
ncbi:MAG: hypothetical protein ACOC3D_01195 [Pseudomonadota bacterium]